MNSHDIHLKIHFQQQKHSAIDVSFLLHPEIIELLTPPSLELL